MKPTVAPFPATRLRRNRRTAQLRGLVRETTLSVNDLIWPVFVMEGRDASYDIPSMPGVQRLSVDRVVKAAKEAAALGIPAICLFPFIEPDRKTEDCAEAWDIDNLSNRATKAIRDAGIE
ncbi:MAG TPA: porphobilinogen synthase, partial [Rhodobacteraceae bacterium]|nr:porphobilinogen synthase [Paracoccaceae bacterium]